MTETDIFNALKYRTYDARLGRYVWHNSAGELHRENGPAVEYDNGSKYWYQNNKRHRIDGPARDPIYGPKEWYIDDQPLTKEEFDKRTK